MITNSFSSPSLLGEGFRERWISGEVIATLSSQIYLTLLFKYLFYDIL